VSVEVSNESGVEVDVEALAALARYVLDALGIHPQAELSILLMDEDGMTALHERWMDEPGPTDVMAFPMDELRSPRDDAEPEPGLLGDVVICPQVAQRQAQTARHALADEVDLLCTHGILHLLGHDHYEPDEQREMFGLQARLLAGWQGARSEGQA
jgi:probable rRNA maturation factor